MTIRYTLRRSLGAAEAAGLPPALSSDVRVRIIERLPRVLLLETTPEVAEEWKGKLGSWTLLPEATASVPDPRPSLRVRLH